MRANRRRDTKPELALRSAAHAMGARYRVDYLIRVPGLRVHPDLVFTRRRVAVFVDGCFWHRCPEHATNPRANADYWGPKLLRNVERDREVDSALAAEGWIVLRIWEHEAALTAARRILSVISSPAD